ncbi:GNAT family N-acetyltransferase [Bdellovibrio sp. HCB274]|uniref:GNAT family N-acetyltransferase n=1 Tax=Bdellovibrio sp. HCB274 TaxID=3394361 RepID=UPI0039B4EF55
MKSMTTSTPQAPRLIIKPWTEEQAADFLELSNDEGFTQHLITDYRQTSIESAKAWIKNNSGKFAVIEKSSGNLIGMGGLTKWRFKDEELFDITYRLRSSAQGKGYGHELARALVDFGFNELHLDQITATITPDNIPSKKLAEKLGMQFDQRIELLGVPTDLYRLFAKER